MLVIYRQALGDLEAIVQSRMQVVILHHATTIREGYQAEVFAREVLMPDVSHLLAVGIYLLLFVLCCE